MKWILASALMLAVTVPAAAQNPARMPMGTNGGLTPQMFRFLDADKDGMISADEYRRYQDRRFRGFDEGGRGQFGRDTFRHRMAMMHGRGRNADQDFRGYDLNRDGTVTREEWMTWAENRFKQRDANGDGKISRDDPEPTASRRMGMPGGGPGPSMRMMGNGGPRR